MSVLDPLNDNVSSIELVQYAGSDRMIVNAARVSYANDADFSIPVTDADKRLIKYLIKNRHGSPFEHNLITYRCKAPLYVVQEMLRHRIGCSFNQESHRYIQVKNEELEPLRLFYLPQEFRQQDDKNRQSSHGVIDDPEIRQDYIDSCEYAFAKYEKMLSRGVCREQARGVLPHCTYSSLYFTLNIRSLMHFLSLRLDEKAQWEIRQYAIYMKELAKEAFPIVFSIYEELEKELTNE